ncbi:IclR family transcriptional regulator [Microbacterium pseudoresistens]
MPTAYRYVGLLKELRLLDESSPGRYGPTAQVIPLARAAQLGNPLGLVALPVMEQLVTEFNETVIVVQFTGESAECIRSVETDLPMRYTFQPGRTIPVGKGASGKMTLAALPPDRRATWLNDLDAGPSLRTEIDEIIQAGFATSSGELHLGVWACSVPITSGVPRPSVLSLSGPAARIGDTTRAEVIAALRKSAEQIREDWARFTI